MPACQFCDFAAPVGVEACPSCGAEMPSGVGTKQPTLEAELRALVDRGDKISAINRYRASTGVGLAEAKQAVEDLVAGRTLARTPDPMLAASPGFETEVLNVLSREGKIAAIKRYREHQRVGLKEAKEAVEAMAVRHGVAPKSAGCFGMLLLFAGSVLVMLVAVL